ncbi:MAG: 2-hydroxyacyl-CoA dehydratase [Deltaproteobacteria bacterium]|nr:2-hydroxyacyl-CoA dehydratase [Deltaproteobacteria bacterium]MBW2045689.1 2-hydroxyacyl-CoA dehydratase [Deltaproteobacteria bacterium]
MQDRLTFKEILQDLAKAQASGEGKPLVGWTCTYLPVEILEAAGLQPYRILPEPSSEKADGYLDPNMCPLVKTNLGKAITGGYSFLSGIIILNTCDGMRRLYDAWRFYCPSPFSFLLDVPKTVTSLSVSYFKERLKELATQVEKHFKVEITTDSLNQAIEEANLTRSLSRRLISLQGRGAPPVKHSELLDLLSLGSRTPRSVFNKALEKMVRVLEGEPAGVSNAYRLLLTGSSLDGSALVRLIEELGGEVTISDICPGTRFVDYVEPSADPLFSLSHAYLHKTACARMFDSESRISALKESLLKSKAQGVVYFSLKFCDPFLYEAPFLEEALRELDIPVLFLEGEYTGRVGGGVRTRVQAFLEMLEKNGK